MIRLKQIKAGQGHPEGRATDVVVAKDVAELDGAGVAAVFAADAKLKIYRNVFSNKLWKISSALIEKCKPIYFQFELVGD